MMLEGLRVIEMSTYVAAPGAGGMLRDWGAEVIKVEPLTGCPMRSFFEGTKSKLEIVGNTIFSLCLLYTSPSPRDKRHARRPSSA